MKFARSTYLSSLEKKDFACAKKFAPFFSKESQKKKEHKWLQTFAL